VAGIIQHFECRLRPDSGWCLGSYKRDQTGAGTGIGAGDTVGKGGDGAGRAPAELHWVGSQNYLNGARPAFRLVGSWLADGGWPRVQCGTACTRTTSSTTSACRTTAISSSVRPRHPVLQLLGCAA
jgi:hypothetical protein